MAKSSRVTIGAPAAQTLVLDNGAYSMKAGFAKENVYTNTDCHVIPNCIARGSDGGRGSKIYIADQLESCRDFAEMVFRRPVEKGYVVNWEGQEEIWKHVFFDKGAKLHCDPHETNLVLTEAPNCPQALQSNCDQMIFEEFEFASYYRCSGSTLNAFNDIPTLMGHPQRDKFPVECLLVVDSGHSHTTIMPILSGRPIQCAIKRLDVGGKFLTNRLKELISLRHFGLMDDPYLADQIKEDVCFVSPDFKRDLENTWKGSRRHPGILQDLDSNIVVDYVLPDYQTTSRGCVRRHDPKATATAAKYGAAVPTGNAPKEDFFPLGNERFVVPELLFNPTDLRIAEAGIAEAMVQSLSTIPQGLWPGFLANVVVVGGNVLIPGFVERLDSELRQLVPVDILLRIKKPSDPITYSWLGGARMAADRQILRNLVVTREEYQEHGAAWTARQFATASAF